MSTIKVSPFLRNIFAIDAVTCLAAGLLMAVGGSDLASLLAFPEFLLRYAGLFLIIFGGFVGLVARRATIAATAVWVIVICNALWAAESVAVLVTGWVAPNALGVAFVLAQAAWVGLLAGMQYACLRRERSAGLGVT